MLSEVQKDAIIVKINQKINLPLLGEKGEAAVLKALLNGMINRMEPKLPAHIKAALVNPDAESAGIDKEALKKVLKQHLIEEMKGKLSRKPVVKIIGFVVNLLGEALKKGKSIETADANADADDDDND